MSEPTPESRHDLPDTDEAAEPAAADASPAEGPRADDVAEGARSVDESERGEAGDANEADAGEADGGEKPADPVAAAEAERDEYLDLLRRERAEFENFRKRANKEQAEALDRGAEQVCSDLLLVLDNYGYTLQAAEASTDDQLAKGVEMVHRQLVETLERVGLEAVPGEGAVFDPTIHEAVAQVDAETELGEAVDEPVVVEVMRPGYRFKERLLRPAAVKVAK